MKLTIPRDSLADAVAWAAHALTTRPAVPVLTGLLLEADAAELVISAFDYDTSRRISIGADVAEPGRVLLPGRVLAEIVKSLPKHPVTLTLSGAEITITCGSAEFVLLTLPADDYPTLPEVPEPVGVVDGHAFASAVAQVAPAAANDTTLPMLHSIRVDLTDKQITLAATDRYRIAATTLSWESHTFIDAGIMIPSRTLADIAKSFPAGPVTVGVTDGIASLTGGGRTTTVRLLDEQFIDYNARLGLKEWGAWVEVDTGPLISAVKRVALVLDKTGAIRLSWTDGEVLVQAGGGDAGRGAETVVAELDGTPIEIAFQPQYLLDGLAGVEGGRARIGMNAPSKPALIVPADGSDTPAYRYLVMALRLA